MFAISNYKNTSLTRKAKEVALEADYSTKVGSICYTVCVYEGTTELPELRKTSKYVFTNNQLIDPATGERKAQQNETNDYTGEFDYLETQFRALGNEAAMAAKIVLLDANGLI